MSVKTVAIKLSMTEKEINSIDDSVQNGMARNRADFCRKAVNKQIEELLRR